MVQDEADALRLEGDWYHDPDLLAEVLSQYKSVRAAGRATGVDHTVLLNWMGKYGIPLPSSPRPVRVIVPEGIPWGQGQPQLVQPAKPDELVVIFSDCHAPYQDFRVIHSTMNLIRTAKPDRVVINGDVADFFQLSRFNTSHEREDDLQTDLDAANAIRRLTREAAPDAVIDETEGNHDSRIKTYILRNAKALSSLDALHPNRLFGYDELGIHSHPGCGFLLRPGFLVKHGTRVSATPGGTAKAEALANLCSGVSGHVHRDETFEKVGAGGAWRWTVSGCTCRLDPDYITGVPDWRQGILVVQVSAGGHFHVDNVRYSDGALVWGGVRY